MVENIGNPAIIDVLLKVVASENNEALEVLFQLFYFFRHLSSDWSQKFFYNTLLVAEWL